MLNQNQINKLKNKVGKKVEEKIFKRDQKEKAEKLKNLKNIRYQILEIQKENPKRGGCLCVWDDFVYILNKKGFVISIGRVSDSDMDKFDLIFTEGADKQYYLMNEREKVCLNWVIKHFAEITIALRGAESKDPKESITSKLMLGKIVEDFAKEFPEKLIIDFKQYIESARAILQENLNQLPFDGE